MGIYFHHLYASGLKYFIGDKIAERNLPSTRRTQLNFNRILITA